MNKEIKEKWVKALRSGEYKQGVKSLKINDSFCCLGVLCDIYHKETGNGEWVNNNFIEESLKSDALPNENVVEWAGLEDDNPWVSKIDADGVKYALASYNDSGASFNDVADVIEKEL